MNYNNYFLDLMKDIWAWITRDESFCPHCMRICVLYPLTHWLYERDLKRFKSVLRKENPSHQLTEDELIGLHAGFREGYKHGKISYIVSDLADISDWSGIDRWNYESDLVVTVPKNEYTAGQLESRAWLNGIIGTASVEDEECPLKSK